MIKQMTKIAPFVTVNIPCCNYNVVCHIVILDFQISALMHSIVMCFVFFILSKSSSIHILTMTCFLRSVK